MKTAGAELSHATAPAYKAWHRLKLRQKCGGKGQVVFTQQSARMVLGMCRPVRPTNRKAGSKICTSPRNWLYQPRKKIAVTIPAGIDDGQSIRIREKGEPGINRGPRGDLLVEVRVARHPIFQRQDMNIFSTAPIFWHRQP